MLVTKIIVVLHTDFRLYSCYLSWLGSVLTTHLGHKSRLGGVHKLCLQEKGGSWSKILTFRKLLYHRKCKQRGVGGQKKPNFVNVVCERPLIFHINDLASELYRGLLNFKSE